MVLGWMLRKNPLISARPARALQNIVSKHSSQFRGNAQHDALEFLLWLLDRMHEDLGAASPAQQSRGPTQVGGWHRGVTARPGSGGGVRGRSGARTPGCAARHWGGAGPAPAGMGMLWFGGWVKGWWEPSAAGLGRAWGAGRAGGVGIPALGGILALGEEEMQPPRPSLPPAKPAVITARRLCCWQNE